MFCQHCGQEVKDEAVVCIHCGCQIRELDYQKTATPVPGANANYDSSKTGIGVVMALFLGFIGLIIGLIIYPYGSEARRTFVKGFWSTFGVVIAILCFFLLVSSI